MPDSHPCSLRRRYNSRRNSESKVDFSPPGHIPFPSMISTAPVDSSGRKIFSTYSRTLGIRKEGKWYFHRAVTNLYMVIPLVTEVVEVTDLVPFFANEVG